jgi:transcriptional regulator GlxA family with amidase domain
MLVHGFVRLTGSQGDAVASMTESGQILPSRVVAILAFEGVQPIDISGPAQGFTTANEEGAIPPYSVHVVGPEPGVVRTASGFGITVEPCPSSDVDTLVVPGGPGVHAIRKNLDWLTLMADMAGRSGRVCSVCTGAFLMAAASLLDGRRAVTHWRSCDLLASDHPGIIVDPDPIFIEDGKYWTTAGVTAGIDLTLALIERDHGAALASRVARRLVVPMRRPGGQKQLSEMLALQSRDAAPFEVLLRSVAAHPARDWSVETMAAAVGQSPRNFHRRFEAATQTTPAQAIERIRAEMARTLLQTIGLRMGEIAVRSGFMTEARLRRAVARQYEDTEGDDV